MIKEEKKRMLDEVLASGKWTDFLNALPLNRAEEFQFKNAGQILTLKAVAGRLNSRPGHGRTYSVKNANYEDFTAIIEANKKDGSN